MKWTVTELNKYLNRSLLFEEKLDFSKNIVDSEDIKKIDSVQVKGNMSIIDDKYVFDYSIKTNIYLECAITLNLVKIEIDEKLLEIFSDNESSDDNLIDGITIDLSKIIWLNILSLKPMKAVSESGQNVFTDELVQEDSKKINPAFRDLENFLKGGK